MSTEAFVYDAIRTPRGKGKQKQGGSIMEEGGASHGPCYAPEW